MKMQLLGLILNVAPPRGPKYRKSSFWDRFWLCFCSGVQKVEYEASGIDFERGSAEGSKISKVKLLGSILAMFLPSGQTCLKSSSSSRFWPWSCPGVQKVENQASGIDFGHGCGQRSKTSTIKLLASVVRLRLRLWGHGWARRGKAIPGCATLRWATLGYATLGYAGLR